MSTLSKAVQFRALAHKLEDNEYNIFLSNFLANCGRDMVLTWLFQQFVSKNDKHFSTQSLDIAVNDIENIIQSRESKPNQLQIEKKTMDSLPDALHREIASYLKDKDYIAFSKSNRSIFVSCNSPNCLKYLDLTSVDDYSSINLQNFPQIEHLKININKFNEFQLPPNGTRICNHLSHLTLDGDSKSDIHINIEPFSEQNCLNITNLAQLNLRNFGKHQEASWFCHEIITRLLSKFSMIRYLSMKNTYCNTTRIDNKRLMDLLPNLQGFEWNGGVFQTTSQFIGLFGNKLNALKFLSYSHLMHLFPSDISFDNLQDLLLWEPRIAAVNAILKTAKHLKQIQFFDHWGLETFSDNDWKDTMYKLLSEQHMLQYVDIKADIKYFGNICEGLECGLYESNRDYNDIKIKLEFVSESAINTRQIFVNMLRILTQLESAQTANFMLLFNLWGDDTKSNVNDEEWNKGKEKFINKNSLKYTIYIKEYMIAVSNKNCKINNGYLESWIIHQD